MRQQACADAQGRVTGVDPLRPGGEVLEQGTPALALVLLLDGAAVEQRLAQDPAVVGTDQVALDQQLRIVTREVRLRRRCLG
jgi:hypothetical protein